MTAGLKLPSSRLFFRFCNSNPICSSKHHFSFFQALSHLLPFFKKLTAFLFVFVFPFCHCLVRSTPIAPDILFFFMQCLTVLDG